MKNKLMCVKMWDVCEIEAVRKDAKRKIFF